MIYFEKGRDKLVLIYQAEYGAPDWVAQKLREGQVTIARTFSFRPKDLIGQEPERSSIESEDDNDPDEPFTYRFALGVFRDGYYRIAGARLGIDVDVFLHRNLALDEGTFVAHRKISIFRRMADLVDEDIYIGGDAGSAIPVLEFKSLLEKFPNSTEVEHYARSRIARVLKDYLGTTTDAEKKFETFLRRRQSETRIRSIPDIYESERRKYEFIRDAITEYLREQDSFGENQWRDLMLQFLLLIFPKYVGVLRNVRVKDFYSNPSKPTNRYIDVALIDTSGHIDVIEIKKPFESCLVSTGQYRDNFTPRKELSGAVMQAEKYLFHLSKWGVEGEEDIKQRQSKHIPPGLQVRITNPRAIIIAGRSHNLSKAQLFDFEFMKRKYANVMDILSYDDLLFRLSNIISKFDMLP